MLKHIYETLTTTLELCRRYFRTWAGAGLLFARVFIILSVILSFLILTAMAFVFKPVWVEPGNLQELIAAFGDAAFTMGLNITIACTGMLAAYIRQNLHNNRPFASFDVFSKTIPGNVWNFFILVALLMAILSFLSVHGGYTKYAKDINDDFSNTSTVFRNVNGRAFLPWLYDMAEIISSILPMVLAGLFYLKTSRLPYSKTYIPAFTSLIITGYACKLLMNGLYVLVYRLFLQPLVLLLNSPVVTIVLVWLVQTLIYINCILVIGFLVYSAFNSGDETLDVEEPPF